MIRRTTGWLVSAITYSFVRIITYFRRTSDASGVKGEKDGVDIRKKTELITCMKLWSV
jgi:hypothetical protein